MSAFFYFFFIQSTYSPEFDLCCLYMAYMDGKLCMSATCWHQDADMQNYANRATTINGICLAYAEILIWK